jgi:cell wall-associated NlpC family hydrolase
MLRYIRLSTAAALAFALLITSVAAQFSASGTTTENLRLREHPSLTSRVLDTAPRGSSVSVTQEIPIINLDGIWYPVIYNGTAGFMAASFLNVQQSSGNGAAEDADAANESSSDIFIAIGRTTQNLRLRAQASLSARVLSTAPRGSSVAVTQSEPVRNDDGDWYPVVYNGAEGFMSADFLDILPSADAVSETGFIKGETVNFRSKASAGSDRIGTIAKNTRVDITGVDQGWYAVRHGGKEGFIRSDLVILATGGFTPVTAQAASNTTAAINSGVHAKALSTLSSAGVTGTRRELVEASLTHIGKPYRFASAGPNSFDCSGFVFYIFNQFGHKINRSSADQYRNTGSAVSKGDLLPGDLVFFRTSSRNVVSHVGIYIGGGQFVHSSSGRARSVTVSPINTGYYRERYVGAKRVLP